MFSFRRWLGGRFEAWRATFNRLQTPRDRLFARIDLYLLDHGFLRAIYANEFTVCPGVVRRSQPSPRDIRRYARLGYRTVVNLRGPGGGGAYALEREACAQAGLRLLDVGASARRLPGAGEIMALDRLFASAEKPMVMHCKSGADRAGLAAALYVVLAMDGSAEAAQRQLGLKFLHVKSSSTGILDEVLKSYAAFNKVESIPFRDWVAKHYDPEAITAAFHASRWSAVFVDWILRRE